MPSRLRQKNSYFYFCGSSVRGQNRASLKTSYNLLSQMESVLCRSTTHPTLREQRVGEIRRATPLIGSSPSPYITRHQQMADRHVFKKKDLPFSLLTWICSDTLALRNVHDFFRVINGINTSHIANTKSVVT